MTSAAFDAVIVGGGTAGCVLAGRLSENPQKEILLIEAGPDTPPHHEHPDIRDSFPVSLGNPSFWWRNLFAQIGASGADGRPGASVLFVQGFGIGGSSNIQGMFAVRGIPEDYDEWRDNGIPGWGWDDVLPYFKKLETDQDFRGPLHGDHGPIPIRRTPPDRWAPFSKAVGDAIARRRFALFPDYNGDFCEGLSSIPMANLPHMRVSASMGYLTAEVRQRRNLKIVPDTAVERLDVHKESGRARVHGVWARIDGTLQSFRAGETIVACGALQSPALLMRSGIGSAAHLNAFGIEIIRDLPGVGRNLQNHPKVQDIAVHLPNSARQAPGEHTLGQNCLRYSSGIAGCGPKDMFVTTLNKTAWHSLGQRIGAIAVVVHKPYSKGSVELASRESAVSPKIRFNALSDSRDSHRLVEGLRTILGLLLEPDVSARRNEAFLPQRQLVARLAKRRGAASLQAAAIAALFEIGPLRRRMLNDLILDIPKILRSEQAMHDLVHRRVELSRHPAGTCKMGPAADPEAVLDSECRVRGVDGLRVVDASIFPTLMRANTHIPVLMAAEKMADQIKSEWRG